MNKFGIKVSASTNGLEVLESGLVHLTTPEVEFKVDNLVIRCIFENDDGGSRFEGKVESEALTFRLYNFNNSIGEGNDSPLAIATIKNRDLFFHFHVNTYSNSSASNSPFREFKYSFMLGAENEA